MKLLISILYSYGIFKRTINLPLFHPYFINYGANKEQYYNVLNTMGIISYHILIRLPL